MCSCASKDSPTYIYKLVPHTSPVPAELPDALPVSNIDQASGFIHLSTARQITGTLVHFFGSDPRVHVLRLAYAPLADAGLIKWEDPEGKVCGPRPGEGTFPHLYNGFRLGKNEIESLQVLEKGEGSWEEAIARDAEFNAWLVF
ncbi:hypothetical protein JVU11DRAFT_8219 [Chiua virens]|nr:hypothetical protein JVU11DRAFT_11946 [Chiua virens]KAG9311153.1 hypothetical protein JVU11DRAFT_8219 [Chiua virens]